MRYPEYYVDGDDDDVEKENGFYDNDDDEEVDYEYAEHLRFTASAYRHSLDENSVALKEYNNRPSAGSNRSANSRGSAAHSSSSNNRRGSEGRSNKHESAQRRHNNHGKQQHRSSKASSTRSSCEKTIALFGANGVTGHHFLQLAVEAGYQVRALILPGFELEDMHGNPNLTLIHGTMDDEAKIHRVIRKASYVVCMLNDCPQALEPTPAAANPPSNYDFIQKLVPLMSDCSACKVLMYQATSSASDCKGSAPMLTSVVKKMAVRKTRREMLQEQDRIVKYISKYVDQSDGDESPFQYIITRPSEMIWDRPSRKKLAASKSLPGPFPITNVDLAEFSLNALKMEKLYNTCPYVVQDGI